MQFRPQFRVASAMLLAASLASAQALSGVYTVDDVNPAGPTNFNTLQAASAALTANGVAGPVQFFVINNGNAYAGFSLVAPPAGSGPANPISFIGVNQPVINTVATGFVQAIRLGTGTLSATLSGGPTDITLEGLVVTGTPSGAGISICQCQRITVRNCHVHTAGSGIALSSTLDCVIEDNEINGVANTVGAPHSSTYAGGISVYQYCSGTIVRRNRIHDCTGNGMHVGTSGSSTVPVNTLVANNMIWNCPGLGSYPGGISIRRGSTTVANNSVHMTTGANAAINATAQTAVNIPLVLLANNICKHDGTGACIRFEAATDVTPPTFNNNLYDPAGTAAVGAVGVTLYPTLAAWQALAFNAGKETASIQGGAGFLGLADLHITPASPAFEAGLTVAAVTDDIDLNPRPLGGAYDIGADEAPASGLFAAFTASPTTGQAGQLTVNFTDTTFSSSGPVTSWLWNFGDGNTSTAQNPTHTYMCPGTYTVSLAADDGINPTSTVTKNNLITATQQQFAMSTSGGGVGDLTVVPVPTTCGAAAGSIQGWSLLSLTPAASVGSGPFFGIVPDALTFLFLYTPAGVGSPVHFVVAPPFYPDGGPVVLPPGSISNLAGLTLDGVIVYLNLAGNLQHWTNVARITV
jgi:PKD repeat protein